MPSSRYLSATVLVGITTTVFFTGACDDASPKSDRPSSSSSPDAAPTSLPPFPTRGGSQDAPVQTKALASSPSGKLMNRSQLAGAYAVLNDLYVEANDGTIRYLGVVESNTVLRDAVTAPDGRRFAMLGGFKSGPATTDSVFMVDTDSGKITSVTGADPNSTDLPYQLSDLHWDEPDTLSVTEQTWARGDSGQPEPQQATPRRIRNGQLLPR
ncbi:hypothetical protein [Nocardia pseudobrasiliensis]|uniref:Uncharacterized protein n=1 Tax=Nocardia pseudobrasiliensis TaxID=45979 RepID=A0A370IBU0_9NOCA|nr:hypothetical protein [Nocardia pseudobrasiliensis]RDI68198.1 hypothetical protein DFR76_102599 [Nocardia pseudobrasiliensis]